MGVNFRKGRSGGDFRDQEPLEGLGFVEMAGEGMGAGEILFRRKAKSFPLPMSSQKV